MKIVSEIPVSSIDIERETELFLKIFNTNKGTLSIFSRQLSLAEYERFEAIFRYSVYTQIFIGEKNNDKINDDLYKLLKNDLNIIRIEPYRFLLKQIVEISEIHPEDGIFLNKNEWTDYLFNCKELGQEDLVMWCRAVLKYNISYKKKLLNILQGVDIPLENWIKSDSINSVSNQQDYQSLGETLYGT